MCLCVCARDSLYVHTCTYVNRSKRVGEGGEGEGRLF